MRMRNDNLHRIHIRCSMLVMLIMFVISLLMPNKLSAQDDVIALGLKIERMRLQQQTDELYAFRDDIALRQKPTLGEYAAWCARLIVERQRNDVRLLNMISNSIQSMPEDHPCAPLWTMLGVESFLYDICATHPIDPATITALGYPTDAQRQNIHEFSAKLQPKLANAYKQLEQFPIEARAIMQQRCAFLLAQTNYLLALSHEDVDRKALLTQAHEVLQPLLTTVIDEWQMQNRAIWLDTLIRLALGNVDASPIITPHEQDNIQTRLIHAKTMATIGKTQTADALLNTLAQAVDTDDPTMQLAIADSMHQLWFARGDYQRAFGMYLRLLNNKPSQTLYDAIASRWHMPQVTGNALEVLPDDVLFVIAQQMSDITRFNLHHQKQSLIIAIKMLVMLRDRDKAIEILNKNAKLLTINDPNIQQVLKETKQQLKVPYNQTTRTVLSKFVKFLEDHDPQTFSNLMRSPQDRRGLFAYDFSDLSTHKFNQAQQATKSSEQAMSLAIKYLTTLRQRESVVNSPMHQRVQLLWARIMPMRQPDDVGVALESLGMLSELASHTNDQALVYDALNQAIEHCNALLKQNDANLKAQVISSYQPIARILFGRFNTSELADNTRLFDVVAVRLPAKEYALALQRLADMPANHPQYWQSLRYQLGIYRQLANHPDWPSERIVAAIAPIRDQAVRHLPGANNEQQQTIAQVAIEASGMLWQAAVKNQDWQSAADQLQWLESSRQITAQTKRTWLTRRLVSLQRAAMWQATNRLATQLLHDDGRASFPVIMQIMEVMQQQRRSQTHAVMLGKRDAIDAALLDALSGLSQSAVKWAMVNVEDEHQVLLAKIIWAACLKESGQTRDALALLTPLTGQFGDEPDLLMTIAECHFKLASPANFQQAAKLYHQIISRSLPDAKGKFPSRYWQAWTRYLQICDRTKQHTDVIASRINSLKAEDPTLGGEPWAVLLGSLFERYTASQTPIK